MVYLHIILFDNIKSDRNKKYVYDFPRRLNIILLANKYDGILKKNNNQTGGKLHIIEMDGYKFKIDIGKMEDMIMVNLEQSYKQLPSYATVLINKEGICALQGISVQEKCTSPPFTGKGHGSLLSKFIIRFLQINKDRLKLKRVELRDESNKQCMKCNKNVRLTTMHTLLYGDTWYGRYGFRPIQIDSDVRTKELQVLYDRNKEIINKVLVKNIQLIDIIMNASVNSGIKINRTNLEKYLEQNKDRLLKEILGEFLKNYEDFCCLFEYMTDELFIKLGLFNFEERTFYIDL